MTNESTSSITKWYSEKEHAPEINASPQEKLMAAIDLIEKVAYAKGLRDGLERLERMACIIPNRYTTGPAIIKMLQTELNVGIVKWKRENNIS